MKKLRNVIIVFFCLALIAVVAIGIFWRVNVSAIDKKSKQKIEVVIAKGSTTKEIAKTLKLKKLVRNEQFVYAYLRLMKINNIKASTYELSPNMDLEEIVDTLVKGNSYNENTIKIVFKEGINIKQVADQIEAKTERTAEEVYDKLKDEAYLDEVIAKYWFVGEEVKNPYIFYSLEGYLYPDTYSFENKDVSVEVILDAMLKQMGVKLSKYKDFFKGDSAIVHRTLTLASIVELEGVRIEDRKLIAGVFEKRLREKWPLGSDVTTYYGARIDMSKRDLYAKEINGINMYNTRPQSMAGKLPIGPVANPSIDAIGAVVEPTESQYYFFVADKYRRVFFTRTNAEHEAKVKEIKAKGEWIQW